MDIGKIIRIVQEPDLIPVTIPERTQPEPPPDEPISVPDWPVKKEEEVEAK
jgi:hypothetical protein